MTKKQKHYLIIILTIIAVILSSIKFNNLFGSDTDWLDQHTIIPEYFRQMFYKTGKIIPNLALNYGGGQNIFNLSYYGLLSPIILISYAFPFLSMTTYIEAIMIIIVIGSAILFYNFLEYHKFSNTVSLTTTLIFSLSACFIFQAHRHIMFVDYMPFLIGGLIGVDYLSDKNKRSILIINVFLMIMTSYYYSICGILVIGIYYLYRYLSINKFSFKKFIIDLIKFISNILISVLLSGILIIPTAYTLLAGRGTSSKAMTIVDLLVPSFNLHKLFCGTYAIGLSIIAFIAILYLIYTKKRQNVIIGSIITMILFIPIFRYILNGGLYLREKCFIPFLPFLSFFVAYFLEDLFNEKINIKRLIPYLFIILSLLYYFNQKSYCFIFALLFLVLLAIYNKFKKKLIIIVPLIIFSLSVCFYENFHEDYVTYDTYNTYFNEIEEEDIIKTINEDKGFFRTINLNYPAKTINKIYDDRYYSTAIYSSTYNNHYLNFVRNVFSNSMIEYNYFMIPSSNNLLFNRFMGVKYINSSYNPGEGYEEIKDNIYKDLKTYPVIYANRHIISKEKFNDLSYPNTIESLMKNVVSNSKSNDTLDSENIKKVNIDYEIIKNDGVIVEKNDNKYTLNVKDNGTIVLSLKETLKNKILFINLVDMEYDRNNLSLKINDVENYLTYKGYIYDNKNTTFHYVISKDTIDVLEIKLTKGTYNFSDIETYIGDYGILSNSNDIVPLDIKKIDNSRIDGSINIDNDSYLVTSIPYDKGFDIIVNGIHHKPEMINEGFLGLYLEKGNYDITILYKTPGLKIGIIASAIGFIFLIIIIIFDIKKKRVECLQ